MNYTCSILSPTPIVGSLDGGRLAVLPYNITFSKKQETKNVKTNVHSFTKKIVV